MIPASPATRAIPLQAISDNISGVDSTYQHGIRTYHIRCCDVSFNITAKDLVQGPKQFKIDFMTMLNRRLYVQNHGEWDRFVDHVLFLYRVGVAVNEVVGK